MEESKKSKSGLWVGGVLLIIILAGLVWFMASKNKAQAPDPNKNVATTTVTETTKSTEHKGLGGVLGSFLPFL